jgi:hypothetical protein
MSNTSKREIIEISLVIFASIIAFLIMFFVFPKQNGKTYDCRMAEISPDFPPEVRNECRKLRAGKV